MIMMMGGGPSVHAVRSDVQLPAPAVRAKETEAASRCHSARCAAYSKSSFRVNHATVFCNCWSELSEVSSQSLLKEVHQIRGRRDHPPEHSPPCQFPQHHGCELSVFSH